MDHAELFDRLVVNASKLTGGRWVTSDRGNKLYIRGGAVVAGNPHVLKSIAAKGGKVAADHGGAAPPAIPTPTDVTVKTSPKAKKLLKQIAPDHTPESLSIACGALSGSKCETRVTPAGQVVIDISHGGYTATRRPFKDKEGNLALEAVAFHAKETGKGLGLEVMASMAHHAREGGFKYIETHAAGYPGAYMNGYYTWPRFGYDGPLSPADKQAASKDGLTAGKLSDLMKTAAGRQWWKENGSPKNLKFDLSPDSLSTRVLDAYRAEKLA